MAIPRVCNCRTATAALSCSISPGTLEHSNIKTLIAWFLEAMPIMMNSNNRKARMTSVCICVYVYICVIIYICTYLYFYTP